MDGRAADALLEREQHPRVPAASREHGGVDQVGQLDVLARQALGGLPAGERLQALQQMHDPVLLSGQLAHQRPALPEGQVGVAVEGVEVGAHAGERGAQLVTGVGGEAAGRVQRALQRLGRRAQAREHLVERAGERAHLVGPLVVGQRRGEVVGVADPRGAGAQARERPRVRAVKAQAASPVTANAPRPIRMIWRRIRATRACTGARLVRICTRSAASGTALTVIERHGLPPTARWSSRRPAGTGGGSAGTSPLRCTSRPPAVTWVKVPAAGEQQRVRAGWRKARRAPGAEPAERRRALSPRDDARRALAQVAVHRSAAVALDRPQQQCSCERPASATATRAASTMRARRLRGALMAAAPTRRREPCGGPRLAAGLELAAQVADEDVDDVGLHLEVVAPDRSRSWSRASTRLG